MNQKKAVICRHIYVLNCSFLVKLGCLIILQISLALLMPLAAHAENLSLRECLSAALINNPSITEAKLNVQAGEQGIISARGKQIPRISLEANYTKRQDPIAYIPAQSPEIGAHFSDSFASLSLMMTMPLYQGGQITNGIELAELRTMLLQNTLNYTKNELIANTVNTYNKLIQTARLKEASQSSLKALEEQHKNARLLFDVGRIARVDLLKIEVQLANERQRLLSLQEAEKTLTATLRFLMGQRQDGVSEATLNPTDSLTMTDILADFATGLSIALKNRPEYLTARASLNEAELNRKLAFGKFLPTVNVFAGYLNQYGFNPYYHESNWITGINLSLPLFDRSLFADYKRENIQKSRAEQRLLSIENQIRLDVQTALSSLQDSKNRVAAAQEAVAQAEESFRIEQQRYSTGAGVMSDLLLAQAAAMTAAANYTQALFDYNAAVVAWRKATGTLEEYLK
jgi:outer membrane protein